MSIRTTRSARSSASSWRRPTAVTASGPSSSPPHATRSPHAVSKWQRQYPRKETPNDAAAYHGPLHLYEAAGFAPVHEGGNVVVVQKTL
jgi:hypothetical protein